MKQVLLRNFKDICNDNLMTKNRHKSTRSNPSAIYHKSFDKSLTVRQIHRKYFGLPVYVKLDRGLTSNTNLRRKIYSVYDMNKANIFDFHIYDCWIEEIQLLPDELFEI